MRSFASIDLFVRNVDTEIYLQNYRFLQSIQLNDAAHKVDWAKKDLSYLLQRNYDPVFSKDVIDGNVPRFRTAA